MKKVLVFTLLCALAQTMQGSSEQVILRTLIGSHTRALDNQNMYAKPLDESALAVWYDAISEVKNFVENNSIEQKAYLMNCYNTIWQTNDDLIKAIKGTYNSEKNNQLTEQNRLATARLFMNIADEMVAMQDDLKLVSGNTQSEKQAIILVGILAKFVGVTAKKAAANLDSISSALAKKKTKRTFF
jgi:hypothetical protein